MLSRSLAALLPLLALVLPLGAQTVSQDFNQAGEPEGWRLSGGAQVDAAPDGDSQALRLPPGSRAVWSLRDQDASGTVTLRVYDDMTAPAKPKDRRGGPQWGLVTTSGRVLVAGAIYAPYLSGDTSYASSEYDPDGKPYYTVTYLGVKRTPGWHTWTFDFNAEKGLRILHDGQDVNKQRQRYDWNKSQVGGFSGVVLIGDEAGKGSQTLWVDDVKVELGGPMQAQASPPPPPAPVVPEKDPPLQGEPAHLSEQVMSAHPRLLFGPDDVAGLRAFAQSDDGKPFMDRLMSYLPSSKPPREVKFLTDATDGQRQGLWRMPTVALHYVLTGDKTSFDRAVGFMQMLLDLEHWETGDERDSGMSAANIMIGAALTFDWLYNDLDPAFREKFRQKLWWQARAMYHGGHLQKNKGVGYWQNDPQNNHRWHRDAGLTLAALTAYTGADDQQWLIRKIRDELDFVMQWLPDDGTSHEGPTYMIFGGAHLTLAMDAADRAYQTHYLERPFFKNVGPFLIHALVPDRSELFNFGDSGGGGLSAYSCFIYKTAAVHHQPDMQAALDRAFAAGTKQFFLGWMPLVWRGPTLSGQTAQDPPTRSFFEDIGLAFIRDGWGEGKVGAMFKCGPFGGRRLNEYRNQHDYSYINVAHDDPDANSFIVWKDGDYIAETDRYSKHKQSDHYNTILINGMGQMAHGRPEGGVWSQPATGKVNMLKMAYITAWKDGGKVAIVEGEAAGSYLAARDRKAGASRPALDRYRRTFIWVQGDYVLVLDDIRAPEAVDITWLMQSPKLTAAGGSPNRYILAHDDVTAPFQVVSDGELAGDIGVSTADHRGKVLGWQQLRLKAHDDALRVASVYDLWNRGEVTVKLTPRDADSATVTVTGPGFADTWTWQAGPDAETASILRGTRGGKPLADIDPSDRPETQ